MFDNNKYKIDDPQQYIIENTDKYFTSSKVVINKYGDSKVVYAYFVRHDSIYSPKLVINFIQHIKSDLNLSFKVHEIHKEGEFIKAKEPIFFIEGNFKDLSELETLILQKIGFTFVVAYNAYVMSTLLPSVLFLSMGARHYADPEMSNMIDYGISVGSQEAQKVGARGFKGSSTKAGSAFFGLKEGVGTMPHSLIGYAGSTLKAAKMYYDCFIKDDVNEPEANKRNMVILVDYFGKEITDSLQVCKEFKHLIDEERLFIRIDTNGNNYLEGLNEESSQKIINKYCSNSKHKFTEEEQQFLIGKGVSAAAVFKMRESLDEAGFEKVKIVVSSGFNIAKCNAMSKVNAPIDIIGTGSILDSSWEKSFATADIISYDDKIMVKKGREHLAEKWKKYRAKQQ